MNIIAHRGCSERFPENTMESFSEAILSGTNILEADICLTLDKILVITHNNVDKVTGKSISKTKFSGHLGLDTFLQAFYRMDVLFVFDVKEFTSNTLIVKLLMDKLYSYDVCHRSTIASFNGAHVEYLRDYRLEGIKTALISESIDCDFFKKTVEKTEIDYLIVPVAHATKELIDRCPVPVMAYTCNTPGYFKHCLEIGIHGIFSDCPECFKSKNGP